MAKRLNKKVAIIGSLVLAMLIVAAIVLILTLSRNPEKFIADAKAALALAEPDYKAAEKAYGRAFAYSKGTEKKIDILFKLADMYLDMNEWPKVASCWNKIINYDTRNLKARLALLDYSYQIASNGSWTAWKEVESNVSELIGKELDTSPKMYRIKGQALLELVKRGQATDKETGINDAIENLQKANQEEPNNVDVYQYLADAITQKGQIFVAKGVLNAADNAKQEAIKVLLKGVENLPNEPKAYINLYSSKLAEIGQDPAAFKKLESDIIDLTEKFKDSPLPYFALVQLYNRDIKGIEKAIAAAEKAKELDKQNVSYSLTLADLRYRRYAILKNQDDFQKAIDIATEALGFPDSLDIPGPRARISFINRYSLHNFLANCFVEKAVELSDGDAEKAKWLQKAEQEVYQINQLLGSAENPYAIMWRGRLLLAEGKVNEAIVQLNAAYDALTAAAQTQADTQISRLSYDLARIFQNSSETGAAIKYYSTAFKNGIHYTKPDAILDFASVLLRVQDWSNAFDLVDFYEKNFSENNKSRILRVGSYIGANMFDEAKGLLDKMPQDDPNVLKLKFAYIRSKMNRINWGILKSADSKQPVQDANTAKLRAEYDDLKNQLNKVSDQIAALGAGKLAESELIDLCKQYVSGTQNEKAQKLVNSFLKDNPNSVNVKVYQLILNEPAPANVPPVRVDELTVKVVEALDSPLLKASLLGEFYHSRGQDDKAVEYYNQVLALSPGDSQAVASLYDIALSKDNFKEAERLTEIAGQNNIDLCGGEFFKARLEFSRKDYQKALERTNNTLEKRPVFSQAYFLRSQINMALEKQSEAVEDAKKAYQTNPMDSQITRNYAFILYERNRKLGTAVSSEQITEMKNALDAAIRTNPTDISLSNFYAEYISDTEPERAIAICQQIQKAAPTVDNSLKLANLALKLAEKSRVKSQGDMYLSIARDAYEKVYKLAPLDTRVLTGYSEFLKNEGKAEEAEKMLAGHDDILWRFYVRNGKIDEAQQILTRLYEAHPEDANTIKGLILVSRTKKDQAGILKYTAELLKLDKSVDNEIIQIETYLDAGIVDDAQEKLTSLRERYPDEPRAVFLQTWLLAKKGKLDDALKLANKNLELDKNNARAWQLRGQINLGLNNFNGSIDDFQKSKTLLDNAEIRIDLARAYLRVAKEEQAIVELKTAVDEYGSGLARSMLEEVYIKFGKQDSLEKFYNEAIRTFPNGVYWYDRAGEFLLSRKNFDNAYKVFDVAFQNSLKINSESPDFQAFDGKLRSLFGAKKHDQLFAEATKYLDGPLATIAYARMAGAKAEVGDQNTAIQYFRRALEKAGTSEGFIIEALRQMNQVVGMEETVKWCNEKLQTQPDSLAVNLALYNLYGMAEEYNKALEYVDKCIKLVSDNEQVLLSYQMSKAGILYSAFQKTGDKDYLNKTIQEYESILKKQPTNISVLNNIAYMLIESGTNFSKALEYAERAYKSLPNNPSVLDTYGYVLLKNEKAQQADEIMQRALQQFEQNKVNAPTDVYEHVGMVKEKLGQDAEALTAYKRALELVDENVSKEVKDRVSASVERLSSGK